MVVEMTKVKQDADWCYTNLDSSVLKIQLQNSL